LARDLSLPPHHHTDDDEDDPNDEYARDDADKDEYCGIADFLVTTAIAAPQRGQVLAARRSTLAWLTI
jgi:hypothetical protein